MTLEITKYPIFRDFWYPVLRESSTAQYPVQVTILGEQIAIWRDQRGKFSAVKDSCPHRGALLSAGSVVDGNLQCAYHGWQYDQAGVCIKIPQQPEKKPCKVKAKAYLCTTAHGYVWVCLGEQHGGITSIPEASLDGYHLIHEFIEPWACNGLRIIENGFDNAHFSFVHNKTFGVDDRIPMPVWMTDTSDGFKLHSRVPVKNPIAQQTNLGIAASETIRDIEQEWFMPFGRRMRIKYPNGVVHTIMNWATPIDDRNSLFVQFAYRYDAGAKPTTASIRKVIAWDRAVTLEDKNVLEAVAADAHFNLDAKVHMPSDKPGIVMRKKLKQLISS